MKTYAPKGKEAEVSSFVNVSSVEKGVVAFAAMGGGFVMRAPTDEFHAEFVELDESELEGALGNFRRIRVETDGWYETGFETGVEAWTNGKTWNGWQVPLFTAADLKVAMDEGLIQTAPTAGDYALIWSDTAETFVELLVDGTVPGQLDVEALAKRLLDGDHIEQETLGASTISAILVPRQTIAVGGRDVDVFAVGDGWCWQPVPEKPSEEAEHSAAPKI